MSSKRIEISESIAEALDSAVRLARRDPSIGRSYTLLALRTIKVLASTENMRVIEVAFAEWGDYLRIEVTVRKGPVNELSTELMWRATNIKLTDKRHGDLNPVWVQVLPNRRFKFVLNAWP